MRQHPETSKLTEHWESRGVWKQAADPLSKDLADKKRYLSKVVHTELLLRTKVPYLIPT